MYHKHRAAPNFVRNTLVLCALRQEASEDILSARSLPKWSIISYVQEERGDELKWIIVAQHLANTHLSPTLASPRADNLFRLFARLLVATLSATLDLDAPTLAAQLQRRTWTPITSFLSIWADTRYATPSSPTWSQLPLYDVEVIHTLTTTISVHDRVLCGLQRRRPAFVQYKPHRTPNGMMHLNLPCASDALTRPHSPSHALTRPHVYL